MRFKLQPLLLLAAPVLLGATASTAYAQDLTGRCATPDSIGVRGNSRVTAESIKSDGGLATGTPLNFPAVQRAVKAIFSTGQFDDVHVVCDLDPSGKATLVYEVKERPVLSDVTVSGTNHVSARTVRDKIDLLIGRPVDPAAIAHAVARIDSVYQANGYYLTKVTPDTVTSDGRTKLNFRVEEGNRLAISGILLHGTNALSPKTVVGAMQTKPEGFLWFRKGELDENKLAGDLAERIPQLYAKQGFIDFQIAKDTLLIDRDRGKAVVDISVDEGKRYKLGTFDVVGNRRFSSDEIANYNPFNGEAPTLTQRVKGLMKGGGAPKGYFDRAKWDEATERVQTAYRNEGYIYANIRPVVERTVTGPDSQPTVNLRWEITENSPAIINRVDIAGNDYTTETCIREQLLILPGDVFNQDRLMRSWQNIGNLGFFETPLPFPDTRQANEQGDIDVVFKVKEKRTGSVNFGASMGGGGYGVGGFIGVDQPNLFGMCKRGSLNWQFGRFVNDFTATYQDPTLRKSRVSGTFSLYRSQSRFVIGNLGTNTRTGGSFRFGFPVPGSIFSRLSAGYTAEAASFANGTTLVGQCSKNCFRSNLGLDLTHDTRIDLPFPSAGGLQTITADFSGGPLGGVVNFQRYTGEVRGYAPLAEFGGKKAGSQPIKLVLGLRGNMGALFGNPGPYFFQQQFAVGGVQYGQALRGYPEFSITPNGFDPTTDQYRSQPQSYGSAFMTLTGELGLRINQSLYMSAFYDAGNNWRRPSDFNPTRLFRGAGFGLSTVTPLGPLGLDIAYGFDRFALDPVTGQLHRAPRWQPHFRLGQIF
jgi:outer membrane protein insertion porin family